ncbi:MAG: GNAT family N-acetyltransferase [Alphaproteobacteria bacterium]|nr:GNAT family N-acetyltransferase [Alphaproteobacteria bacterium]
MTDNTPGNLPDDPKRGVNRDFNDAAKKLDIVPVTPENLQLAIDTAVEIFGDGDREAINEEFKAALGIIPTVPPIETSKFFIAYRNGAPAGVTGYYTIEDHPDELWLNWMGVLPQYRGQGIGTALVQEGFIENADDDAKTLRIWTTTEEDYDNARKLYKKMGFTEEDYKPGATDAAKMVVVFSRPLDAQQPEEKYLWKHTSYPIDAETHVIPDLNHELGLGDGTPPATPGRKKPGAPRKPGG